MPGEYLENQVLSVIYQQSLTYVIKTFGSITTAKKRLAQLRDSGLPKEKSYQYLTRVQIVALIESLNVASATELGKEWPALYAYIKGNFPGLATKVLGRKIKIWSGLSRERFRVLIRKTNARSRSELNKLNQNLYQATHKYHPKILDELFPKAR